MNDALVQCIVWLDVFANALSRVALAPLAYLPGWLSSTVVAVVTGILMLLVFKYTSNQRAIQRARNDIKANLLALKLFKDSARVALRSQGRILWGAGRLLACALTPMLVMMLPVILLTAQLAQWYQARPLAPGEQAIVTLKLGGDVDANWPSVSLRPTDAVQVTLGPVRVLSQRAMYWRIQGRSVGSGPLLFAVGSETFAKEVAVGDRGRFLRTSPLRPGWSWTDVLMYPAERPFRPESAVQEIAIEYPIRAAWTCGTDWWMAYWFGASTIAAFCLRRPLNVQL